MKYAVIVLFASTLSFGAAHVASRTVKYGLYKPVKYVATTSPYGEVKNAAKGVSFPFRHPVKTAKFVF